MAVYPPQSLTKKIKERIVEITSQLAVELKCIGIMNIQFIIHHDDVYVLEVNPRASRTVPFLSKVTGIPMAQVATRVIMGEKLVQQGYKPGLAPESQNVSVKAPVFSFNKLLDVDSYLGPEMKSTGEVMGTDRQFDKALYKAFEGAGMHLPKTGTVLLTIDDRDKQEALQIAQRFEKMGFRIEATEGTAKFLKDNGLHAKVVGKIHDLQPNLLNDINNRKLDLVINTMGHDQDHNSDGFIIRQAAIQHNIPLLTALKTADALLKAMESRTFMTRAL